MDPDRLPTHRARRSVDSQGTPVSRRDVCVDPSKGRSSKRPRRGPPPCGLILIFKVLHGFTKRRRIRCKELIEQVVIEKDRRKKLTVGIQLVRLDPLAVAEQLATVWHVQSHQKLNKRRVAAAVFADDKDRLTGGDCQSHWPKHERIGTVL